MVLPETDANSIKDSAPGISVRGTRFQPNLVHLFAIYDNAEDLNSMYKNEQ